MNKKLLHCLFSCRRRHTVILHKEFRIMKDATESQARRAPKVKQKRGSYISSGSTSPQKSRHSSTVSLLLQQTSFSFSSSPFQQPQMGLARMELNLGKQSFRFESCSPLNNLFTSNTVQREIFYSLAIHCHRIGSSIVYGQQVSSTWAWKFHLRRLIKLINRC